jgi:hypothetical protein
MYVWTRKEIAEAFSVSASTPHYWIHHWGPETDHPFPEPIATLALPRGRHHKVYDPGSVQVWWADLPAAKHRRLSQVMTGKPRHRTPKRPPMWGNTDLDRSIIELEESMALLMETINEMEALRVEVLGG